MNAHQSAFVTVLDVNGLRQTKPLAGSHTLPSFFKPCSWLMKWSSIIDLSLLMRHPGKRHTLLSGFISRFWRSFITNIHDAGV